MGVPIYTTFDYIYPGPHLDENDQFDPRVWFNIPLSLDAEVGSITYLLFPFGGGEDEVREVTVDADGSWIA